MTVNLYRFPLMLTLTMAALAGCESLPKMPMTHGEGSLPEQRLSQARNPVTQEFSEFANHFSVDAMLSVRYCNFWEYPEVCHDQGYDYEQTRQHLAHGWIDLTSLSADPALETKRSTLGYLGFSKDIIWEGFAHEPAWKPATLEGSAVELRFYRASDWELLHTEQLTVSDFHHEEPDEKPRLGFWMLKNLKGKLPPSPSGYWLAGLIEFNHPKTRTFLGTGANPQLQSIILPLTFHMPSSHEDEMWMSPARTHVETINVVFGDHYKINQDSWLWERELETPIRYQILTSQFAEHAGLVSQVSDVQKVQIRAANRKIAERRAYYATYTDERELENLIRVANEQSEELNGLSRYCLSLASDIEREARSGNPWGGNPDRRDNELDDARETIRKQDRALDRLVRFKVSLNEWFENTAAEGASVHPTTLQKLHRISEGLDNHLPELQTHCNKLGQAAAQAKGLRFEDSDEPSPWSSLAARLNGSGGVGFSAPAMQVWRDYNQNLMNYQAAALKQAQTRQTQRQVAYQHSIVSEEKKLERAQQGKLPTMDSQDPAAACLEKTGYVYVRDQSLCTSLRIKRLNDCLNMGGKFKHQNQQCTVNGETFSAHTPTNLDLAGGDHMALFTRATPSASGAPDSATGEPRWLERLDCGHSHFDDVMPESASVCANSAPPAWEMFWRSNDLMGGTYMILFAIQNKSDKVMEFDLRGFVSGDTETRNIEWKTKVPPNSRKEFLGGIADLGEPAHILKLNSVKYREAGGE